MSGKVYLVGAGTGDEGLMTLRGLQCLKEADVIVYDRLASERPLDVTRKGAEKIYAGKFASHHTLKQEEINVLLAQKAQEGKVVVRLKGGDPFIFGRGGEEAEYLADQGIDFEVVPGVSSAYAVPAYAGIPVTQRGHTSTVAFITGHEDDTKDDSDIDWAHISTGVGTLVFLMGVRNLELIVKNLIEYGRPPETPVAVIRWGTTPQQQTIVGTLADIVDKVREAALTPPAITVVGEVVRLREKLNWFEKKPLFGKTILVTRARPQASQLVEKLSQRGAQVIEFPTIKIVPPSSFGEMDQAIQDMARYDWVIFSSVNGVESFFQRLRELGRDVRELKGIKIAVVGPKTREKIEDM
ncbi:uroporphyrin-III C-methyltransferase / precorrin-2 dehydrogenase / sirohydrochlorin ferrochelatase, partial [Candidatus Hakubella thermalkaliphila]